MTIRVFLVEDDPLVAMMLEGYLDVLGHEIVATAATVAEALELVAKRDFDLTILDVHLADGKNERDGRCGVERCREGVHSDERRCDDHGGRV